MRMIARTVVGVGALVLAFHDSGIGWFVTGFIVQTWAMEERP